MITLVFLKTDVIFCSPISVFRKTNVVSEPPHQFFGEQHRFPEISMFFNQQHWSFEKMFFGIFLISCMFFN